MSPEPIDLHHLGRDRIIASYLLDTDDGPALFDCGPSTTIDALKAGLADRGLALTDVRHLLLTHIHLDHAGAAGTLVREHPALQVHVSPIGAPHLVNPSRLEKSARRLYGDTFDSLWGELAPVPEQNVRPVGDRVLGLDCFPTPGHASHHVCYLTRDGTLHAGDAVGVRIQPGRYVFPAGRRCPIARKVCSQLSRSMSGGGPRGSRSRTSASRRTPRSTWRAHGRSWRNSRSAFARG